MVTGGSGFVGSHLVDRLVAEGRRPRIFDRRPSPWRADVPTVVGDLNDLERVCDAMAGCAGVIHLAASANVNAVLVDPAEADRDNVRATLSVLEAARRCGVPRVIYASTIWVYSDTPPDCQDERLPPHPPVHFYTATKLAGELYCRAYAALYDVPCTILRFGIPYGPRARATTVVPAFTTRALAGEPLTGHDGAGDRGCGPGCRGRCGDRPRPRASG